MLKTTPLTLAQLRCFQSPARVAMYSAMRSLGPCSIRELAQTVGSRPDALYYHMRLLIEAELAVALEPRERKGRKEAIFDVQGGPYDLDELLADQEYREAALASIQGIARHSLRTLMRAMQSVANEPNRSDQIAFHWINAKLRPETIAKVLDELNRLILHAMRIEEGEETERMMIFAVAAPIVNRKTGKK
jgi:DNA-binding transcriptional ArsR family regulator